MAEGQGSWLKYGCFGCLGIVGVVALAGVVVFGIAANQAGSENVLDEVLTPTLPVQAEDAPEAAGLVSLDLRDGDFEIEPAAPGSPLRVEARYAEGTYVLEERTEENPDGSWSYRMSFKRGGSWFMTAIKQAMGGSSPEVHIYLPPDVPLGLEIELHQGGAQVELGGLWLVTGDIELDMGGMQLSVVEPLRGPMERLTLSGSMGGMQTTRLGNASPRELEVDFSMGGLVLDLRGQWTTNGKVTIGSSMGGGVLRLPDDVWIEGLEQHEMRPPAQAEVETRYTLTFDADLDPDDWRVVP